MDETKICIRCGVEKPLKKFKFSWGSKKRKNQCSSCTSRWYIAKFKLEFLEAFDFRCSCCGERNPYFLTLDHRNNDGAEHRRRASHVTIFAEARREKFDKSKWDCLCMNCNFAKGHYGECPHRQGKTPESIIAELQASGLRMGRKHHDSPSRFSGGFDPRRMQLNRRKLKKCSFCSLEFGTHEMARHKREQHAEEVKARRTECLRLGRERRLAGKND